MIALYLRFYSLVLNKGTFCIYLFLLLSSSLLGLTIGHSSSLRKDFEAMDVFSNVFEG